MRSQSRCFVIKHLNLQTNFEKRKYSVLQPIYDANIVDRVKQYLLRNRHLLVIDSQTLVNYLRENYEGYKLLSNGALQELSGRVIAKLSENFDFNIEDHSSNNNELLNNNGALDVYVQPASMNDKLANMYASDEEHLPNVVINSVSQNTVFVPIRENRTEGEDVLEIDIVGGGDANDANNALSSTASSDFPSGVSSNSITSTNVNGLTPPSLDSKKRKTENPDNNSNKVRKPNLESGSNHSSKLSSKQSSGSQRHNVPDRAKLIPKVSFDNVAGCKPVLSDIVKSVFHLCHPEIYSVLGIEPPRGFLLHGPPGCGKTLLANAVAGELKLPLVEVAAPELVTGVSGESEERIRKIFDSAKDIAPCILFIDEIDAITPNRNNVFRDMEKRIVSQLLVSLDRLNKDPETKQVLVIGATNRPDSLDPAIRRAGRFDKEVCVGIPNKDSRYEMLKLMCSKLKLASDVNLADLSLLTPGYVGADLLALIREATINTVHRSIRDLPLPCKEIVKDTITSNPVETVICKDEYNGNTSLKMAVSVNTNEIDGNNVESTSEVLGSTTPEHEFVDTMLAQAKSGLPISEEYIKKLSITNDDFLKALKYVQPSSKREGFATVPNITWDDVGSLKTIRNTLKMAIVTPIKYSKQMSELGLPLSAGVLLCGPPGCGKTLLAKAIANEAGINFISVKGPELLNMYVGGSERAVRDCFQRARNSQPCVIFFDELDALCPRRVDFENASSMRVVNQMLTEMDGVEGRPGVFVMAATNRPDIIDPAVLRPGRFDKILFVGFPNADDRLDILLTLTKNGQKPLLHEDVSLKSIADLCEGFTGADLSALVRDTSMIALEELLENEALVDTNEPIKLTSLQFEKALANIRPSVTKEEKERYEAIRLSFATP